MRAKSGLNYSASLKPLKKRILLFQKLTVSHRPSHLMDLEGGFSLDWMLWRAACLMIAMDETPGPSQYKECVRDFADWYQARVSRTNTNGP